MGINSASSRTSCLLIVANLQLSTNKSDLMLVSDNMMFCQTNSHYFGFGEKICLCEVLTKYLFNKPKTSITMDRVTFESHSQGDYLGIYYFVLGFNSLSENILYLFTEVSMKMYILSASGFPFNSPALL